MFLRIETIAEKKLAGKSLKMSFTDNRTGELWKSFMPLRKTIEQQVSANLFSVQQYDELFSMQEFDPHLEFVKRAAVEVSSFSHLPAGIEPFVLPGGLYAVFLHKGAATDTKIFQYIFREWIPASAYVLDNRPHFELLGEKYKNDQPDSEEEIWIPVKAKL